MARSPIENRGRRLLGVRIQATVEAPRILAQVGPNATSDVAIHPLRLVLSKFLSPVSVCLKSRSSFNWPLSEYVGYNHWGTSLV
jgi:hypothetical protein